MNTLITTAFSSMVTAARATVPTLSGAGVYVLQADPVSVTLPALAIADAESSHTYKLQGSGGQVRLRVYDHYDITKSEGINIETTHAKAEALCIALQALPKTSGYLMFPEYTLESTGLSAETEESSVLVISDISVSFGLK
jgi:hypothetical protein